jgi:alpha-tubulin suppressor-like RCC1 family protein
VSVTTGLQFSAAVQSDGTLWAWGGANLTGGTARNVPGRLGSERRWRSVFAVADRALVVTRRGELYGWGSNTLHSLGLDGDSFALPQRIEFAAP